MILGAAGEVLVAEAVASGGGSSGIPAEGRRLFVGVAVLRGTSLTAVMFGGTTSLETLADGIGFGAAELGGLWLGRSGLAERELEATELAGSSGVF